MKKLFSLSLLILFLFSCSSDDVRDVKFIGLNGKINSVKDSRYETISKFGEIIPGELNSVQKITFDNDGNIITNTQYDKDGEIDFSIIREFENGKLVSNTFSSKYGKSLISKIKSRDNNKEIWEKFDGDGNLEGIEEITFSKSDLTETVIDKDKNGNQVGKYINKYDKRGNQIENIRYTDYQENPVISRFKFDNYLLLGYEYDYGEGDSHVNKFEYSKFDDKGNWIEQICTIDGAKVITIREIEYK